MDFEALERLGRLRSMGAISDDEFETEKNRVLGIRAHTPRSATQSILDVPMQIGADVEVDESRDPNRRAVLVIVAVITLGAVAILTYEYVLPGDLNSKSASSAPSVRYELRSRVSGIHIAPTAQLPRNPHGDDSSCEVYEHPPVSSPGRLVRSRGWHVISENGVGKFRAISFAGACASSSSGGFTPIDANVGIYEGSSLKAVIYGKKLGFVRSTGIPTELRITDAASGTPVGKIIVTSKRISIQK